MGSTTRFGLHYQGLSEAPDGAGLGETLAEDVDGWLSRGYPVADAAARTALSGIGVGFLVLQQDDSSGWIWDGSLWVDLGGSGGGGGGGITGVAGKYRATANQSLTNNTDTVLGFGTTEVTSALVTRATSGVGHKFTLSEDATYAITATVRIAAGTAGPRFIELRDSAQTTGYVSCGQDGGPNAWTGTISITDRFPAAQELVVVAAQNSGATVSTQYQGSSPTVYRVRLSIVKVAD